MTSDLTQAKITSLSRYHRRIHNKYVVYSSMADTYHWPSAPPGPLGYAVVSLARIETEHLRDDMCEITFSYSSQLQHKAKIAIVQNIPLISYSVGRFTQQQNNYWPKRKSYFSGPVIHSSHWSVVYFFLLFYNIHIVSQTTFLVRTCVVHIGNWQSMQE